MRITYLHQYFNTPSMVGGTRSYEMARRLVDAGHHVDMITSWREPMDGTDWFETEEAGIKVHWLPVAYANHMDYRNRLKAFIRFAFQSARRAADLNNDLVFATSTPLTIALPGRHAARKRKIPMVFEVRDLWPEVPIAIGALQNPIAKYLALRLERYAYMHSDRIVALSPGMADGICRTGYPAERVHVIPNASDLDLFSDESSGEAFRKKIPDLRGRPLIAYAGTLGLINGVGYLAEIAHAATTLAPDLRFAIVGEGKETSMVEQRAQQLGVLDRNLFMFPAVSKSEMPGVLAGSDIALSLCIDLEATWANSANKFFDALAAGTPIAVNYGGWQAAILEENRAGVRIPATDAQSAARILAEWAENRAELESAGLAARRLAEERFDRDKLAQDLEHVLLSVLKSR